MKNFNYQPAGLSLIPLTCAVLALTRYSYVLHAGVPVTCALLVGLLSMKEANRTKWLLIVALAFSVAGDRMLKHRGGNVS
ncbi:MAG: hypothetical protein LBC19_04730 [Tannerella sp.]|nr:hypothetical protein [Tannerella sp.]